MKLNLQNAGLNIITSQNKPTFDETYYNFQDHQRLGQGAQGSVFRVVRKDDDEHNVYAAKKFHKNIKDCY